MADIKTASVIPTWEHTELDDIPKMTETLRTTFRSQKTKDVQYRLKQLRKLYWAVVDNSELIEAALFQDLHMCKYEATLSEIDFVLTDLRYAINNLDKWVKEESISGLSPAYYILKHRIRKDPLGTALIVGPYNFPIQLVLVPLIGAISAGCTALVKPSEYAPSCAMVIKKIVEDALDPAAFRVVNGAIPETQALLKEKWDKIFYTGSTKVGKLFAQKAAENLTPITLELGGQNPAFVSKNADIPLAARRLMWSKGLNAGQICISQNYALVERSVVNKFIEEINATYNEFFPNGAKKSPDFARIIDKRQFQRIKKMIDDTQGKIVLGGETDELDLYIEPTVVLVNSADDSMMIDETFGPVWSIMPYDTLDEAIKIANQVYSTPLALFTFGTDAENNRVLNEVISGGATVNDGFMHAGVSGAPFGGVGQSGQGAYRGKASFDTFTHRRTTARNPGWADKLLRGRYMPFTWANLQRMPRPARTGLDFDRQGNPVRGVSYWFGFLLSLGAKETKGTLARWTMVLLSAYVLTKRRGAA